MEKTEKELLKEIEELKKELSIRNKLLNTIPIPICYKNKNGFYHGCNKAFEEFMGVNKADIIGKTAFDLFPLYNPGLHYEMDIYTLDSKETAKYEFLWKKSEEIKHIIFHKAAYLNPDGSPEGIICSMFDITDLVKTEEALKRIQYQQKAILDNIPHMAWLKDRESKFIAVNKVFSKTCGLEIEDIIGKTDFDVWPHDLAEKYRNNDIEVIKSGKRMQFEEPLTDFEGKTTWIETIKTPIYNENMEIVGTTGIARDITEKIFILRDSLRTSHLVSVGELAAGVAHQINNPITGIINYAQILANKVDKKSIEYDIYMRIIKEGGRIARIIKSLLSFARIGSPEKMPLSVKEILSETIALTEAQMKRDCINFKLNIPEDLPQINGQINQIQQVFLNILSNSRYAVNKKQEIISKEKIIKISAEEVKGSVKITFYDNGSGIAPDLIDKIMNPFFSTKPAGEAAGLGLSISYGIISDHNGKISIESKEGEFTSVTITLPEWRPI